MYHCAHQRPVDTILIRSGFDLALIGAGVQAQRGDLEILRRHAQVAALDVIHLKHIDPCGDPDGAPAHVLTNTLVHEGEDPNPHRARVVALHKPWQGRSLGTGTGTGTGARHAIHASAAGTGDGLAVVADGAVPVLASEQGAGAQWRDQQGQPDAAMKALASPSPCSATHHIAPRRGRLARALSLEGLSCVTRLLY
ncbi:hypothetical protein D3C76_527400 [compost metagenome]